MHEALCVLFTGRVGAGKTTVGRGVAEELRHRGCACGVLDAAAVDEHLRPGADALVWCCQLLVRGEATALVTLPIPTREARERLRAAMPTLVEVFLDAPAALCAERSGTDDDEFEEPYAPELRVPTHDRDAAASIAQVMSHLEERGIAPHDPPHPTEQRSDRHP